MSKRKTTNEKQYIAFDDSKEIMICMGVLKNVIEAIECHVDVEDLTVDEIESSIHIYELGPKKGMEVYPGKPEIVVVD